MGKIRLSAVALPALLTLAAATVSLPLRADDPIIAVLKYLLKPFAQQNQRMAEAEAFRNATKYCVVITNESRQPWKLGCIPFDPKERYGNQPSGTLEVKVPRRTGNGFFPADPMTEGGAPVTIDGHFGAVVITPTVTRSGILSWQKFARYFYLEDGTGNRIYFSITKDTSSTASPVFVLAGASNALVQRTKALAFSDSKIKDFNMIGIKVDHL